LYIPRICTIILLTTSLCPLVLGWKEADLVNLVFIGDHRLDQKSFKNLLSLSKTMVCDNPKRTQTHLKKSLMVTYVVILFLQGAKMAFLENQLAKMVNIPS